MSNCSTKTGEEINHRTCFDPKTVFDTWYKEAKNKNYDKMFEYESFNIPNVIYCFEQYKSPRSWDESSQKEKNAFVSLYQKTLKKLLSELKPQTVELILKLSDKSQLKITKYTVNVDENSCELYISGDFPAEEVIKLKKIDNAWYLENPFGYHSWLPTKETLMRKRKKTE